MTHGGWTYILTNRVHGVLYIGVTADIDRRMAEHRSGLGSSFCRRYGLDRFVLAEPHSTIEEAIAREKQLKRWHRRWKIELIEAANPEALLDAVKAKASAQGMTYQRFIRQVLEAVVRG